MRRNDSGRAFAGRALWHFRTQYGRSKGGACFGRGIFNSAFLKEICTLSPVPVYAIGGIGLNKAQLEEVLACGAAGACVRSAFMQL